MRYVLESDIERFSSKEAEREGWFQVKIMRASKRSLPDRLYIKAGRHVFMEWKRDNIPPTEQQKYRHDEMRRHGAEVHVVDSVEKARVILGIPS